jgi:transposase
MLTPGQQEAIQKLLQSEKSVSHVAKQLGFSPATVLRYRNLWNQSNEVQVSPGSVPEKIVAFQGYIERRLKEKRQNITSLFQDLREKGYEGSYSLLYSYIKSTAAFKVKNYKPAVRVETEPGEQAQVDWGSFGKIRIGDRLEKLYAFVYVLSYSRVVYVEFVIRQNLHTLQNCHIRAFDRLGIPNKIRYDNMKTVILGRKKLSDGTQKLNLNPAFKDFAAYYGFEPELCPPYWPRAKGKVEAGVKYLRNNFVQGESFRKDLTTLDDLNRRIEQWLKTRANSRMHGTTREKPEERWVKEKPFLRFPDGLPIYNTTPLVTRWSTKDRQVQYKTNSYSVPKEFAQKNLTLRETSDHGLAHLEIYYKNQLIARHELHLGQGKWVIDDRHMVDPPTSPEVKQEERTEELTERTRPNLPEVQVMVRDLNYYDVSKYGQK